MPNISIITTTYQHADFIAQTIESVLGQTYSDWEMLIGDDSPDDATWDVIQWYVAKYPTKIKARHHNPNKGIVDNMNFLIQQCDSQSDFISFLEGDDMYTADNLMEKIKIFEKYPEVQLVYSDLSFIDKDNTIFLKSYFNHKEPIKSLQLLWVDDFLIKKKWFNIMSRSSSTIRKDILKTVRWIVKVSNEKNRSVSDFDFYIQIFSKYPIYYIDKALLLFRRHEWNLSANGSRIINDLNILIEYYHDHQIINDITYRGIKSLYETISAVEYIYQWNKKIWREVFFTWLKFNIFSFFIVKCKILLLLLLPLWVSKKIIKSYRSQYNA